jgi:hypothetical protein
MWILPRGDRCPMCDAVTERVHAPSWRRLRLAKRWCIACGWEGMMRLAPTGKANLAASAATVDDSSNVVPSRRR